MDRLGLRFGAGHSQSNESMDEDEAEMAAAGTYSSSLGWMLKRIIRRKEKEEEAKEEGAVVEVKEYNVFDHYNHDSWSGKVAMQKNFEHFTLGVISLNAFWIGWDTDHNDSQDITNAAVEFVFMENMFCFYFTAEVIIRFLAFERKVSCLVDHWFKFDFILVSFMILETWIMPLMLSSGGGGSMGDLSILRLLRLFRLTRMARLMRSVPELLTLIKGMVAATRSVFSTLVLLIALMYVFGIIFTSTYKDEPDFQDLYGMMGLSMLVLFVNGTLLDDLTNVTGRMLEHNQFMVWVMLVYILAASFTVLNMLIGVMWGGDDMRLPLGQFGKQIVVTNLKASVLDIADLRKALRRLCRKMDHRFDIMERAIRKINVMAKAQAGPTNFLAAAPGSSLGAGPSSVGFGAAASSKAAFAAAPSSVSFNAATSRIRGGPAGGGPSLTSLPPVPGGIGEVSTHQQHLGAHAGNQHAGDLSPRGGSGAPGPGGFPMPMGNRPRVRIGDVSTVDILNELRQRG